MIRQFLLHSRIGKIIVWLAYHLGWLTSVKREVIDAFLSPGDISCRAHRLAVNWRNNTEQSPSQHQVAILTGNSSFSGRSIDHPMPSQNIWDRRVGTREVLLTHSLPEGYIAHFSNYLKEKSEKMREDKSIISRYIAEQIIKDRETVILDSGTTVCELPVFLQKIQRDIIIYTNNLLVTAYDLSSRIRIFMFGGIVDFQYGAVFPEKYSEDSISNAIKCTKTVLATAGLTYEAGPLCSIDDSRNRFFKQLLVRKCLQEQYNNLIIAVDWTKFKDKLDEQHFQPILDKKEWHNVLKRKDFSIVTKLPEKAIIKEYKLANNTINRFQENREGMRFITVPDQ